MSKQFLAPVNVGPPARELALRPPRPGKLKMFQISLSLCYCSYRDTFDFVGFLMTFNFFK